MELEGSGKLKARFRTPHRCGSIGSCNDCVSDERMGRTEPREGSDNRAGRTDDDEDPACPGRSRPEP